MPLKKHAFSLKFITLVLLVVLVLPVFGNTVKGTYAGTLSWAQTMQKAWDDKYAEFSWDYAIRSSASLVWDGTAEPPGTLNSENKLPVGTYSISNPKQLYWVAVNSNDAYYNGYRNYIFNIVNDLDLAGDSYDWLPIGYTPNEGGSIIFEGTIEGNGHTIYNMGMNYISGSRADYVGLVSRGQECIIRNLTLKSARVYGNNVVAGFIGHLRYPARGTTYSLQNLRVENSVFRGGTKQESEPGKANDRIAPICAVAVNGSNTTFINLYGTNNLVYGTDHVGGLLGNIDSSVRNSYAVDTTVISTGNHSGGFISCMNRVRTIENCFAEVDVYGDSSTGVFIGEVLQQDSGSGNTAVHGTITNCYASGSITGNSNISGFIVGIHVDASASQHGSITITNCYSTAMVGMRIGSGTMEVMGSFIAHNDCPTTSISMDQCYAAGETGSIVEANNHYVGGFIGRNNSSTTSYNKCYFDRQTTTRSGAGGTATGVEDIANITGLLTNSTKGNSDSLKMTGASGTGLGSSSALGGSSSWVFEDEKYPQLTVFQNPTSSAFPGEYERALVKAYSGASVCTPMVSPWESLPYNMPSYDTIRDITADFKLTEDTNVTWSKTDAMGTVEPTKSVLTFNGGNMVHVNTVGIEEVTATYTATVGSFTVEGKRRVRVIPTRSLYAGEDELRYTGDYYDLWEGTTIIDTTAEALSVYDPSNPSTIPIIQYNAADPGSRTTMEGYLKHVATATSPYDLSPEIVDSNTSSYDFFTTTVENIFTGAATIPDAYADPDYIEITFRWKLSNNSTHYPYDGRILTDSKKLVVNRKQLSLDTLYVRQVILGDGIDFNSIGLSLPSTGLASFGFYSGDPPIVSPDTVFNHTVKSGLYSETNPVGFTKVLIQRNSVDDKIHVKKPMVPQYYKYVGYKSSTAEENHNSTSILTDELYVNTYPTWVTLFLEPVTSDVLLYSNDRETNSIGPVIAP